MKRPRSLDRRAFLQTSTAAAAAGGIAGCSSPGSAYRFLTPYEAVTVKAIANQIIPPDDYPGGGDAGAARFIDTQLVNHYEHWQTAYREGLAAIDSAAREAHGVDFAALTVEQQYALLVQHEDTSFFRMIRDHTMQSYYGDPRHGGNPGAISWKMLGVAHPPVRGREHYDLSEEG